MGILLSTRRALLFDEEAPDEPEAPEELELEMNVNRRLDKLEQAAGTEPIAYIGMGEYDWTEADLDKAEAEARARLGPNARIIRFVYGDWPPGGAEEAEHAE